MQARAILEAAAQAAKKTGEPVDPEIMVPLVGMRSELDNVRATIDAHGEVGSPTNGDGVSYLVGTMIELPRAALRAQEIAESADFFSFGTNDLTQTTFGISRDDAAGFLGAYLEKRHHREGSRSSTLDTEGVGVLVRVAAERGRKAKPDLKLGICGEHGGDPASIRFCDAVGLDYVSLLARSACRSPASPPRRRRSPAARPRRISLGPTLLLSSRFAAKRQDRDP